MANFAARLRTRLLFGAALSAICAGGAMAADATVSELTVTATRQERPADEVAATVSVITSERIENELANDIKDLVRFEPGVSVRTAPARFTAAGANTGRDGSAGFNIRGLDGNRVLIVVDGVRVPDAFSFGGQSVGRGDYVDLDLLKSVEILRGPASALYGSDGLAGAVAFTTRDPDDFLTGGASVAGRVRGAYASVDDGWTGGFVGAAGDERFSGLLAYTYRSSHETENKGANDAANVNRTTPNPQDFETQSWLGKLVFVPAEGHRFRLTAETYEREILSEVLSARAVLPTTVSTATLRLDARDTIDRSRVALDYVYTGSGAVERALVSLYGQKSESYEFADEDRNTAADRIRINTFDNEVWGASLQAESAVSFAGVRHHLVYGLDYSLTRQEGIRDGTVPPAGETYPARAFPNTDYTLAGFYLQDEIRLASDRLIITPGLRYDWYELKPEPDAAYVGEVASQDDGRLSPKLGLVYWPTERFGGFVSVAEGYKTPSPSQVNNGFSNIVSNYRTIPNPDLEPETSRSLEVGLRARNVEAAGAVWSGQVTAYQARYKNFIEQAFVGGDYSPANPATFQFVNLSKVEISGVEFRTEARWSSGLGLALAGSWNEGEQKSTGAAAPLNSIDPWKLVAGLNYREPSGRFGGQAIVTRVGEKESGEIDQVCGAAGCFAPDGFTLLDLTAYWRVTPSATVRAGVFNLTDETHWWWSDVRGLAATSTVKDAYTAPGRNFSLSLTYTF